MTSRTDALQARYGSRRPWRRTALVVGATALAALGLAWVVWAAWFHSTPRVEAGLISFSIDSDRRVSATIQTKTRAQASGTCLLRASAADHAVVGEGTYPVTHTGQQTVTLRTERRAVAVEVVSCTTQ